ncbi:sensor histidine kinase [Jeotgalibacillus soli]|uniref:histidine kinase n=1 Tax=Jeotgalibacillus soli TaxID=889306 RepID=A0A0C2VN11_9BACL|nr:HAMP domain-containing sensor histidine kinase [Jeotgalibacillus soli]KIL45841.1 histidine kinase [Jeotgalibacillus soli]
MKLQNKIHLYSSAVFGILLVLLNVSIYLLFSSLTLNSELEQTKFAAVNVLRGINATAGDIPTDELLRAYVPANGIVRIVSDSDELVGQSLSPSELELGGVPNTFYSEEVNEIFPFNSKNYAFVSIPIIWNDGSVFSLQFMESLQSTEDNLQVLRNILIIVTLLAMIPVVLSGRVLSNIIVRPITSMIQTMKEIQQSGQFKRIQLKEKSKDELNEMGNTFNRMIELLESNYDKQEQFVSNASHELKTPLTVIESYASLLKRRGKERPDLFDESVEAIYSEAIRMKDMTQQLLLLARQEEQWNVTIESLNLNQLTEDSIKAFQNAYQREVELVMLSEIDIMSDRQKLKQLIFIFLDNAKKYSDERITIYVGQTGHEGYIRIEDKGIGIPKEDLPKVFDRFYRVDKARSRKSGGSGLGLSLARDIGDALKAKIELDSLEDVGTTATIFLPKQLEPSIHQKV